MNQTENDLIAKLALAYIEQKEDISSMDIETFVGTFNNAYEEIERIYSRNRQEWLF